MEACKAVTGHTDRLQGVVEDPRLARWPGGLAGATVVYNGTPIGEAVESRPVKAGSAAERWVSVQLRKSADYFAAIQEAVKKGTLRLVLPERGIVGAMAVKSVVLELRPIDGTPATRSAPAAVGYKVIPADDVDSYRRFLVQTTGGGCEHALHIKGEVTYYFVRLARPGEHADVHGPADPQVWAFTPDSMPRSGEHAVYIRGDVSEDHVTECLAHELMHCRQKEDGRIGREPIGVIEAEAKRYGLRVKHGLFGDAWQAYMTGNHDLNRD